jgi:D-aminopeptidase
MAVNAVGNATDEDLRHFWAGPFEANGEFGGLGGPQASPQPHAFRLKNLGPLVEGENTTIGIVATDASLSKAAAKRLATSAHDGVARALIPSHMPQDGDLIFTAATGSAQGQLSPTDMAELCHGASLCVARAIARAIYHAEKAPNDRLPTWQECNR